MKQLIEIYEFTVERLEKIMTNSYSYDIVRVEAIKSLNTDMAAISEKCRIIFAKEDFFTRLYNKNEKDKITRNLITKKIDNNLKEEEAQAYKTAFIKALRDFHYREHILPFENEILKNTKNMNYNCTGIRTAENLKRELKSECHKHYCSCQDKFLWDDKLNERYQLAKEKGEANNGIFNNK